MARDERPLSTTEKGVGIARTNGTEPPSATLRQGYLKTRFIASLVALLTLALLGFTALVWPKNSGLTAGLAVGLGAMVGVLIAERRRKRG